MFKLILFILISAGIVYLSRDSLHDPRLHGFFRFFAFEFILIQVLLNLELWFSNPFSVFQLVSWTLLLGSTILAIHGFYLLRRFGRPEGKIENTTTLVMQGAYKYIRHPLYTSLLLFGWGAFCKDPSIPGAILAIATSIFLVATAKVEETENLNRFGADYADYMKKTRLFIPFLF